MDEFALPVDRDALFNDRIFANPIDHEYVGLGPGPHR